MKLLKNYSMISALLVLLTLSVASQAQVVDSGFRAGSWADFGEITLAAGDYTLELSAIGSGVPLLFGLIGQDVAEAYQVVLGDLPGTVSKTFTTVGGTFDWLVGGPGPFTVFTASVNKVEPIPLPSSVIMLGSALAAMVSIGRRGMSRRARA
ncbi:MAG: hypothetical protein K2Y51_01315 [Gammaproteobacteria bacterium]|nr:hypothetical protein [Gammaproteobacteria bacterium]